jgi:putative ABC transport system permease protein
VWLLGLRDLQWRWRRFLIAVLATSIVFALTLLLAGASSGLRNEGRRIVSSFGADAWLVAEGTSGPFTASTVIPADTADEVAALPGVRRADPVVLLRSTVDDGSPRDVNVIGYRRGGIGTPTVETGRLPRRGGEVVADTRLGVSPGESLRVNGEEVRVVGTADGITYAFGTPTIVMPLRDAQELVFAGQPLASAIVTRGVPDSVPGALKLLRDDEVRRDLDRPAKSGNETIDFLNFLLWLVAAGIIGSLVYVSALERVRDFAVLKATGVASRTLLGVLMIQSVFLSVASALVAAGLAQLLKPAFPFEVSIEASAYVTLVVIAVVVGFVASLVGLRRAVGVDPALAFGGA